MTEEEKEETLEEVMAIRQDLNVLASAFKQMQKEITKFVNGMNKDMIKAQGDITKCLTELAQNQKNSETNDYLGLLLSDDLKEREIQLIEQVKQIVDMQSKQTEQPKRKKFLGIF